MALSSAFSSRSLTPATPETSQASATPAQNTRGNSAITDNLLGLGSWLGGGETPQQVADREQQEFLRTVWAPAADFDTGTGGVFDGQIHAGLLIVTLKVAWDFVAGDPSHAPVGTPPAELVWSPEQQAQFKADFQGSVFGAWSFAHTIRSTRPLWTTGLQVMVQVVEDAADPHFTLTVEKLPVDAGDGPASVCDGGFHHAGGGVCDPNAPGDASGTGLLDSRDNQKNRVRNGSQPVVAIQFDRDSTQVSSTEAAKLDPPAADLSAHADWDVELTGRSSSDGAAQDNFLLARARTQTVAKALTGRGVSGSQIVQTVQGEDGASRGSGDRRVDVHVLDVGTQVTGAHEAGHMFGNADEYMYAGESAGDPLPAAHQQLIADNTSLAPGAIPTKGENDSIMSNGMQVETWHYAPFVALVKQITGSNEWTV